MPDDPVAERTTAMKKPGETILVLGGARAGKSDFALRLASEMEAERGGPVCFIATAEPLDHEMRERIARHRSERPARWITLEEPMRLDDALARAHDAQVILVDCMTLLVSNWLVRAGTETGLQERLSGTIDASLALAAANKQCLICVSNEVGLGLVPDTPLGRQFRDSLGRVNQRLAQTADAVYLLVAGIPIRLKPQS